METRIGAAIDAIVAMLDGAGFTLGGTSGSAPFVWDGPVVTGEYSNAVYIGYDADPEGEYQAGDITQEWAGLGLRKRDEEFDLTCAAVALVGDTATSWKAARDTVLAMVETVGQTLRATPSAVALGLSSPCSAALTTGGLFQEPSPNGYQARLVFTIHVKTRV